MILNIVCLHGFTQNAEIIKKKLSGLIKTNKDIKLHYLDGFVVLPPINENIVSRAHWIYSKERPTEANWLDHYKPDSTIYYLEESFESFINFGKAIGGIDGIIGFSQGGCFADYICKMHSLGKVPFDLKFAVFIASEIFNRADCDFDGVQPTIATLHIYGLIDTIIPPTMSENLSTSYVNSDVIIHKGAHVIPSNSVVKTALKKLLAKFIN